MNHTGKSNQNKATRTESTRCPLHSEEPQRKVAGQNTASQQTKETAASKEKRDEKCELLCLPSLAHRQSSWWCRCRFGGSSARRCNWSLDSSTGQQGAARTPLQAVLTMAFLPPGASFPGGEVVRRRFLTLAGAHEKNTGCMDLVLSL